MNLSDEELLQMDLPLNHTLRALDWKPDKGEIQRPTINNDTLPFLMHSRNFLILRNATEPIEPLMAIAGKSS